MKATIALTILMLSACLAAAQEKMAEQLKKAIVEEESNQNLDKAIQAYQNILAQFDEERQTAATALFHLADCYRKQGKKDLAVAAYKRVVQEFSDQTRLANASRNYLSKTYGVSQNPTAGAAEGLDQRQVTEARQRYRELLQKQIALVESQIQGLKKQVESGLISPGGPAMTAAKMELLDLQRTLAAFDAGAMPIPQTPTRINGGSQNPPADVTGTWDVYYYSETVSKDSLVLRQTGNRLAGSWGPSNGKTFPIDGTIDGVNVKVNVRVAPSTMHMSIDAKLAGDASSMQGSWIASGTGALDGTHPWRAVKRP